MSKPCSACEHPDRASVEIGLANRVALRALAKRYGLDHSQLSRHRTNHMDEQLIHRLRVRGARTDEELAEIREIESKSALDHLSWQRARLYRVADRAGAVGDDAAETRAIGQATKTTETIAKLLGDLNVGSTHVTQNILVMPQWHSIRTELVRALKPYPEAWNAVIKAIERVEEMSVVEPDARVLEHKAA